MPITATFGIIFLVAKVDVVGPNPIARSNFIDENQVVTKSLI